jgi:hypothetical protein
MSNQRNLPQNMAARNSRWQLVWRALPKAMSTGLSVSGRTARVYLADRPMPPEFRAAAAVTTFPIITPSKDIFGPNARAQFARNMSHS